MAATSEQLWQWQLNRVAATTSASVSLTPRCSDAAAVTAALASLPAFVDVVIAIVILIITENTHSHSAAAASLRDSGSTVVGSCTCQCR